MNESDTIAAVSTPLGEGGVGVIRVSGPEAISVGRMVFRTRSGATIEEPEPRRLHYGRIVTTPAGKAGEAETVDTGFLVFMAGPASYTGEDVVELHCHGGALVVTRVLEACVRAGARAAGPGEFTRRAFLNGKLDLAQAEAVIDVIRAETDSALAEASARLDGVFSKRVNSVKDALFSVLARVEAELDFPEEEEVEGIPASGILSVLGPARAAIEEMLATFDEGRALKDGIRTVILGRPNVGKSSLLNLLLAAERAIVTPVPGTTRDIIEEVVNIRGLPVRLMDTAGLRETTDHVESIGVERARERVKTADLVLFVVDTTEADFTEDLALLGCTAGKKTIVVANKADLSGPEGAERARAAFSGRTLAMLSALEGTGADELKDAVFREVAGREPFAPAPMPAGALVVSVRHRDSLEKALEGIGRVEEALAGSMPREFVATDLRWAVDRLGEITGETTTEDILDRIFNDFCIGK